uniref:Uncharacterized protein n=1 Tax=Chrysotila carterae TaxID=13221 RepID=A0A7S4BTU0_CHRCT
MSLSVSEAARRRQQQQYALPSIELGAEWQQQWHQHQQQLSARQTPSFASIAQFGLGAAGPSLQLSSSPTLSTSQSPFSPPSCSPTFPPPTVAPNGATQASPRGSASTRCSPLDSARAAVPPAALHLPCASSAPASSAATAGTSLLLKASPARAPPVLGFTFPTASVVAEGDEFAPPSLDSAWASAASAPSAEPASHGSGKYAKKRLLLSNSGRRGS